MIMLVGFMGGILAVCLAAVFKISVESSKMSVENSKMPVENSWSPILGARSVVVRNLFDCLVCEVRLHRTVVSPFCFSVLTNKWSQKLL
jgi:hypothetical protein